MGRRRVTTFARGSTIPARALNTVQDEMAGLIPASGTVTGTVALTGRDGRYWSSPDAGVADGAVAVVDATRDWKRHRVRGTFVRLTAADQRLHGAAAWKRNDPTQAIAVRSFDDGWTGTNTVAIAAAPVIGSGVFAIILDELSTGADRVFLYARESDGALCLFNDTGSALHAELDVEASGASAAGGGTSAVPGFLSGDVDTEDATWTTVPDCTATLAASSSVVFRGMVAAIRDDGTEAGAWTFTVRARRPSSGAPVLGTVLFGLAEHDGTGWDVRVQVSGSDVVVQVHGEAATDITWQVDIETTEAKIS